MTQNALLKDDPRLDHFIRRDGMTFAGVHLIVDLWDAARLDETDHIRRTLIDAAAAAHATLMALDLHPFDENGGIAGVAVLAESHISIHTWPEMNYAAIDIFTCGDSDPHAAVTLMTAAFAAGRSEVQEIRRGVIARAGQ